MTIDLSTLGPLAGSLARAGLPALGTILGIAVPPPFNLMVGPAFAAISAIMGVDPSAPDAPAQVQAKVEADPTSAAAKLQTVEDAHKDAANAANEELRLRLLDVQDARSTTVSLSNANSWMQYGAAMVTAFVLLGFSVVAIIIMVGYAHENNMSLAVYGTFSTMAGSAVAYWLGSSKAASQRADQAIDMAYRATPAAKRLK